ncbi:multiple cyclophane-containing RiPP AmcA [Micromonospora yangpuensis]
MSASPPHPPSEARRRPTTTVYVSRNATTGDPPRGHPTSVPPTGPEPTDPPLLTYAWQVVFERQARERGTR